MTVTIKPGHRGERGISCKAIMQGMPDASAEPVCSCAHPHSLLRTRPQVQRSSGIPCALSFPRVSPVKTRARRAARTRKRGLFFEALIWENRVKARSQTDRPLLHFVMRQMPGESAKSKCQENAAAVANFRHMGAAKRGDPA